jgi:selenide,water dikinase
MNRKGGDQKISGMASCGGCAAKVGPADLRKIIGGSGDGGGAGRTPELLVGTETGDDAAVYRVREDLAVVLTTDFITPVCDDPFLYGQVAAANALSDVFAMGGTPLVAIAVCGFPEELSLELAAEIVAGGAAKAVEAGAVVAGGHTIRNPQLFYGLAVTGQIDPARIIRNRGAQVGDALVLTKPLGTGLIVNGARAGAVEEERLLRVCRVMAELNREASRMMVLEEAHAATDVTGFGLAGHALGMARASQVSFRIFTGRLPLHEGVVELQRAGIKTRGTATNRAHAEVAVRVAAGLSPDLADLVYDPQTSGGLLIALPAERAGRLVKRLHESGVSHAARIGEVIHAERAEPAIFLEP